MKNIIKYISIFSLTLVFTKNSYCQDIESNNNEFTINQLQNDFKVFRESLEESHIGLYLYNSKIEMDSIFDSAYSSINHKMTDREFMILICKITSQIGDGHLWVSLPKEKSDSIDNEKVHIPFQVYHYDDKLYVSKNYSSLDDKDFLGSQIISINGYSMSDFFKEYLSIYNADGRNLTLKHRFISRRNTFTYYFNLLYGYQEKYEVKYIPINDSITKTNIFQGLYLDTLLKISNTRYPKKNKEQKPIFFESNIDSSFAYLKIKTFMDDSYEENKINYEKFLKTSFTELETKNIQNLIIDLRDNPGGDASKSKLLFSYFAQTDFKYIKSVCMKKEEFNCLKYDEFTPNRKFPKRHLKPNSTGTFDLIKHPDIGLISPSQPTFKGNIYVLIDGACFSATSEFLSSLHSNTKAIFIGEESGGNYYGNCAYWNINNLKLPNTKIKLKIPLVQTSMEVKEYIYTDRGLIPNYTIIPNVYEKINRIDSELNFVMKLILKK